MKQKRAPRSARQAGRGPTRRSARLVNVGVKDNEAEEVFEEEVTDGDGVEELAEQMEDGGGAGGEEEDQGNVEVFDEGQLVGMLCNICQATFEKRGNFNRHMKTMHSEKEGGWPCGKKSFCVEKFATKYEMLVHKDECIFVCPKCDWSTGRAIRVEGHLRKHS